METATWLLVSVRMEPTVRPHKINHSYTSQLHCFPTLILWATAVSAGCTPGTWGAGCLQNCTCVTEHQSSPCDALDGTCHCLPGYTGVDCEQGESDSHNEMERVLILHKKKTVCDSHIGMYCVKYITAWKYHIKNSAKYAVIVSHVRFCPHSHCMCIQNPHHPLKAQVRY